MDNCPAINIDKSVNPTFKTNNLNTAKIILTLLTADMYTINVPNLSSLV